MKRAQLAAMIVICSLLLQGCAIVYLVGHPISLMFRPSGIPSIYGVKLVSVTNIRLDPKRNDQHVEVVFSSKTNLTDFLEKYDGMGENVTVFCYKRGKQSQESTILYYEYAAGYGNTSLVSEQNGEYVYAALLPVTTHEVEKTYASLSICSRLVEGDGVFSAYHTSSSNWIVIPKEVVAKALALPPDPEKSDAYQQGKITLLKINPPPRDDLRGIQPKQD